jgi:elongation factor Ts
VPYVHNSPAPGLGSIGVLVALSHSSSSSSSSSAQLPALRQLGRRLAMHIAAASPLYLAKADVPAAALERERAVVAGQSGKDLAGKAPAMAAKILEGKLGKYYGEVVLLEQAFALGGEGGALKVGAWLQAEGARAGVAGLRVAALAALRVGAGGGSGSAPVGQ